MYTGAVCQKEEFLIDYYYTFKFKLLKSGVLQKVPTNSSIHAIVSCRDVLFCVSSHQVVLLRQTDLQSIIASLHQNRQLKLALALLNSSHQINDQEREQYQEIG